MTRLQEIEEQLSWLEYKPQLVLCAASELLRMERRAVLAEQKYLERGRQLDEALDQNYTLRNQMHRAGLKPEV